MIKIANNFVQLSEEKMYRGRHQINTHDSLEFISFGTSHFNQESHKGVFQSALDVGYRSFDGASVYGSEKILGSAISSYPSIARSDLILTTKVWPHVYHSEKSFFHSIESSLRDLNTDHLDIVFLHWPIFDYVKAWHFLEKAQKQKWIKYIAVCNFQIKDLTRLLKKTHTPPLINQIECHPFHYPQALIQFMQKENIHIQAYSALGKYHQIADNPYILSLSEKYNKKIVSIILRWHWQNNHMIITKSNRKHQMTDHFDIYDFQLSEEEMHQLSHLNTQGSTAYPLWKIYIYSYLKYFRFIK